MSSKSKIKKRWKPTIGAPLGPQEQKLVDCLTKNKAADVVTLFKAIMIGRPKIAHALLSRRQKQQKIGAIVARLNKKLKGRRVVAGDKPNTYRLRRVR